MQCTGSWSPSNHSTRHHHYTLAPCCSHDRANPIASHSGLSCQVRDRSVHGLRFPYTVADGELPLFGGHACDCATEPAPLVFIADGRCALPRWDARKFCRKLNSRRILFVGDSTMQQASAAIMAQLAWATRPGNASAASGASASAAGGCVRHLRFAHSDALYSNGTAPSGGLGIMGRGRPWTEWIRQPPTPDIVVLSAGAHVYGAGVFDQLLSRVAADAEEVLVSTGGPRHIWWMTQPAAGCASAPLDRSPSDLPDGGSSYWASQAAANQRYNWREFEARDLAAEAMFGDGVSDGAGQTVPSSSRPHTAGGGLTAGRRVRLMDMRPMWLRPDAHVGSADRSHSPDCLHQCVPGPLSHLAPRVLLQMLQEHA